MRKVLETGSAEETFALGKKMGQEAVPGQVITLNGDLGVGKTVFAQGFAEGLGISEIISSPTFTILQVYEEGRIPLYHFDVYRIEDPEEMYEVGLDEYIYGRGVCLIEWAEQVAELLPDHVTGVTIQKDTDRGFSFRRITIEDDRT